ncbi:uncharacterized protein O3C94_005768 [Discoglossus pictus]
MFWFICRGSEIWKSERRNMTPATGCVLLGLALCTAATWAGVYTGGKAGLCPGEDSPYRCGEDFSTEKQPCKVDDDCDNTTKCCYYDCKHRCLHPLEDIPVTDDGDCPMELDHSSCAVDGVEKKSTCGHDGHCWGTTKCCTHGCLTQCLLPLDAKVGSCPSFDSSKCSADQASDDECHSDDQCPGSERCCCYNCRRKCTYTVRVKSGQCPATKKKCPKKRPKPVCMRDNDCPGNKKCCDQCGKTCMNPKPGHAGFCPELREHLRCNHTLDTPLCSCDDECDAHQKCCVTDNKMQCVTALKEKPGDCPVIISKDCSSRLSRPRCQSDQDCPDYKKCCTSKCGQECTDPLVEKPGACQAVSTSCPTHPPKSLCDNDAHCLGHQKCCNHGCRAMCVDPTVEESAIQDT